MRCIACGKEIPYAEFGDGIVISIDGDFVCDEKCKALWKRQTSWVYENVLQSPKDTEDYLLGRFDMPSELRRP